MTQNETSIQPRPTGLTSNHLEPLSRAHHFEVLLDHYITSGYLVLAVTLSTFVTSNAFAASQRFDSLWDKFFIEKVYKRIPQQRRNAVLDHEFQKECSPDGHWHFHGFLALRPDIAPRVWYGGYLNRHLEGDLRSFEKCGTYRPCRLTSFDINPVANAAAWARYITDKNKNLRSKNIH